MDATALTGLLKSHLEVEELAGGVALPVCKGYGVADAVQARKSAAQIISKATNVAMNNPDLWTLERRQTLALLFENRRRFRRAVEISHKNRCRSEKTTPPPLSWYHSHPCVCYPCLAPVCIDIETGFVALGKVVMGGHVVPLGRHLDLLRVEGEQFSPHFVCESTAGCKAKTSDLRAAALKLQRDIRGARSRATTRAVIESTPTTEESKSTM